MPQFVFTGEIEMVYVDVVDPATGSTLVAVPANTYNLDVAPDALFSTNAKSSGTVTPTRTASAAQTDAQAPLESTDAAPAATIN